MNHHHTGSPDRTCPNCFMEAKFTEKVKKAVDSSRRWKIAFLVLMIVATIGAVALFAFFVRDNGSYLR